MKHGIDEKETKSNRWRELLTKMEELLAYGIPLPILFLPPFHLIISLTNYHILFMDDFGTLIKNCTRSNYIKYISYSINMKNKVLLIITSGESI
jgi:hypothetical protein